MFTATNCDIDTELPSARPAREPLPRAGDWLLGGLVLGQAALLTYAKLRLRFKKINA